MKQNDPELRQTLEKVVKVEDFIPHVSVDCAIFGYHSGKLKILLLKYHDLEQWALPGGFVHFHEDLREAAERVLFERTQLKDVFLSQFHAFGRKDRTANQPHKTLLDNRKINVPDDHWIFQRFVSVGFCSLIDYTKVSTIPIAKDESIQWFDVNEIPEMMMDHARIIAKGLKYLQQNLDTQIVAYNLLPEKFTMNQLQGVYETVLKQEFRRNNFQRKMLSLNTLERLEKYYDGSANKAPYLYRFRENIIDFWD